MMKPSRKKAIETQCWACLGYYADGRQDCECVNCPLYEYMPYRKLEPTNELFAYNPKRVGKVKREECKRELTEEQAKEQAERMKKMHEARKAAANEGD